LHIEGYGSYTPNRVRTSIISSRQPARLEFSMQAYLSPHELEEKNGV
jgi:hypothetical protein